MNQIQKQIVEIELSGEEDGLAWQKQLTDLCENGLAGSLEKILDQYVTRDTLVIDKIEIEMKGLSRESFAGDFLKSLEKILSEKLRDIRLSESGTNRMIPEDTDLEVALKNPVELFIYFLMHGVLPWWATETQLWDFEKKVERGDLQEFEMHHWLELKDLLLERPVSERFLNQFSEKLILHVLEKVYGLKKGSLKSRSGVWNEHIRAIAGVFYKRVEEGLIIRKLLEKKRLDHADPEAECNTHLVDNVISEIVLLEFSMESGSYENLLSKLGLTTEKMLNEPYQDKYLDNQQTKSEKQDQPEDKADSTKNKRERSMEKTDAYFIENAGLVLTAAFLPQFLNACGVADEKEILQPDEAVHLIQFLISETSTNHESALPLNKLLCGLPVDYPVAGGVIIDEEQFNQTNHILDALLEYWPSMKGTSRQGLRESFLKRSGKLFHDDHKWVLQVSQAPYDMLLQDLPWTYTIISMPWMKEPVYVEWNG